MKKARESDELKKKKIEIWVREFPTEDMWQ